ncbi:MAG TPA: hypothetical protein VE081_07730 [Sporichthyaceae bacterium]|nr:hypothetical protein [Sporichthyaceae bacterium]
MPASRTRSTLRGFAAVLILTLGQIGTAAPAFAHGGESAADLSATSSVARAVALAAAALLAGVALIRPLAGRPTERATRLLATAAGCGAVAAVVGAIGDLAAPRYLVLVPLLVLGAGAAPARSALLGVPAGALLVGWLCWGTLRYSAGTTFLLVAHVVVVTVWAGAALASATAAPGSRAAVVRRLGPVAVGAAVLAAATGVLQAHNDNVTLHGLTLTGFGALVVLKVALLVAAGALGLGVRARLRARRGAVTSRGGASGGGGVPARLELGVLVGALVVGAVLTSLPAPGPPPLTGVPLARAIDLDDAITGLVVTPQRPGLNLVHVMTDRFTDVVVDGRRYRAEPRPGTQGLWAQVQLPAGRSLLTLHQGRQVAVQVLDAGPSGPGPAGPSGPDGPECAAAALGAVLGGSRGPLTGCPSQALAPADAAALRAVVAFLGGRGVKRLQLITDSSPRGVAADREVRAAVVAAKISVVPATGPNGERPDAVLAVAGWQVAQSALAAAEAGPAPPYGTYLAPWLLQSPLVAATGGAPLTVLPFDPAGPAAQTYVAALRRVGPKESASTSGFYAYLAALGNPLPAHDLVLYAATQAFQFMGAHADPTDHDQEVDPTWLGGGALAPVSKSLGRSPMN